MRFARCLREAENRDEPVRDLRKRHNIAKQTFYRWRNKFDGMDVADARRLKNLESENERLERLIAEQMLAARHRNWSGLRRAWQSVAKRVRREPYWQAA